MGAMCSSNKKEKVTVCDTKVAGELHSASVSYNCFGIQALARHLKLNVKEVEVGFTATGLDTKRPEFIAMNPHHTIPTYKDNSGSTFWEGNAILRHLARGGDPSLEGRTEKERCMVDCL